MVTLKNTPNTCPISHTPLAPGQTLSNHTIKHLKTQLEQTPTLINLINYTKTHPTTTIPNNIHQKTANPALPYNETAATLIHALKNTIEIASNTLNHQSLKNPFSHHLTNLLTNLHKYQTQTWAPANAKTLLKTIKKAWHYLEPQTAKNYLGPCQSCSKPLYANPNHTYHTCYCGNIVDIQSAQNQIYARIINTWVPLNQGIKIAQIYTGKPYKSIKSKLYRSLKREPSLINQQQYIQVKTLICLTKQKNEPTIVLSSQELGKIPS